MRERELTRLGYAGLIPFGAAALGVWILGDQASAAAMIGLCYGAIIASYMAGMGAGGLIVTDKPANRPLLPGMVATLLAWLAVIPTSAYASLGLPLDGTHLPARYLILIAVFGYLLVIDLQAVRAGGLPRWYGNLRKRLTLGACLSLAAMAVGTFKI